MDLEAGHAWVDVEQSKNGKPIAVPLNATAQEVLRRQLGKHRERVFTYAGKPLATANTRAWRKALKRAGIENFRWHDTRHTWATWHRQSGTPTHELQRLGGWRSSVMVERYAHLAPDHHDGRPCRPGRDAPPRYAPITRSPLAFAATANATS